MADVAFYFDPVCPFAWMTSKWVRVVRRERGYDVEWKLISLRLLNAHVDYDAEFPPEYPASHTAGLRLLRVVAKARAEHGTEIVDPLYEALGAQTFEREPVADDAARARRGTRIFATEALTRVGLPSALADALDDESWDWPASRGSPSSSAACASSRSWPRSACGPTRSASRRTGTAAAGASSGDDARPPRVTSEHGGARLRSMLPRDRRGSTPPNVSDNLLDAADQHRPAHADRRTTLAGCGCWSASTHWAC